MNSHLQIALKSAATAFGVRASELASTARRREVVYARFAVMLYLREGRRYSYPRIGELLRRDHTSVLYGVRRAKEMVEEDPEYAACVRSLAVGAMRAQKSRLHG